MVKRLVRRAVCVTISYCYGAIINAMTLRASGKNKADYFICKKCHFIGHGQVIDRGNRIMSFVMWGIFLIPGPIYSLWRYLSKYLVCPKCKSHDLISLESHEGQCLFDKTLGKK